MKLTYEDLQKITNLEIDESVFVFDASTVHLTHVSLRKSENLKEIRFDTPQPNLAYLDASRCKLKKIIFAQACDDLQAVYLHHNVLSMLEIGVDLPKLELLDVSFNEQLTQIVGIHFLRKLTYFYAHKCDLHDLEGMADIFLRPGFDFNIEENENLVNPPAAIVSQGKDAVIRHFRKIQEEGQDYLYEAKLLILGDPRAGKTTLARKILDTSAIMPTKDETTRGIDLTPWDFNYSFTEKGEQNILVNIWDFGGQTIYKQTHRFFLTQRSLYVVLSDGGSSEKTDFAYWLHQTKTFGQGSPVVVFINEMEYRSFDVPMDALRKINPDLKAELAVNLNDVAGDDSRRFGQIMDKIKMELANLKHLGEPVPNGWKKIRAHFLKMEQDGEKMVTWTYFKGVCNENGETNPDGQKSLAQYFHDIGIFLHFQDDDILRKHIFINKQWILNGAYKVVDSKAVEDKD
ncbi:MAG TPA: hypothetical protein ENK85_08770, partial [Saprospiraceae bacterium]|nr:hypothetical protein [Saprospiraceae bacterium]